MTANVSASMPYQTVTRSGGNDDGEDGVVIVNDAPTGEDIGHCDTEVSGNIQQQES